MITIYSMELHKLLPKPQMHYIKAFNAILELPIFWGENARKRNDKQVCISILAQKEHSCQKGSFKSSFCYFLMDSV